MKQKKKRKKKKSADGGKLISLGPFLLAFFGGKNLPFVAAASSFSA